MATHGDIIQSIKRLEQIYEVEKQLKDVFKTLGMKEPTKLEAFQSSLKTARGRWSGLLTKLQSDEYAEEKSKRESVCKSHITFLDDMRKRTTPETLAVVSSEFFYYQLHAGRPPQDTSKPFKVVQLVEMGENEASALRLINREAETCPTQTAYLIAPYSHPNSGRYWVHYPSTTVGGAPVRPINQLGEKARNTALLGLVTFLCTLREIADKRGETRGMVGTNDDGPLEIVDNPAKPDAVIPFGPCTVDEFFEKLGYLSIEQNEGKHGQVVAIADTKWDERLYRSFKKIFHDPLPVTFTHGNLVPEKVLCYANGGICEITGWEHAGWLPQGWEGVAALRNQGSTNTAATWHDMGPQAVSVLDGSCPLYETRFRGLGEIFWDWAAPKLPKLHLDLDLLQLENIRLGDHLGPPSTYDDLQRVAKRYMPLHGRCIRKYTEKARVQSGDEEPVASDAEGPAVEQ